MIDKCYLLSEIEGMGRNFAGVPNNRNRDRFPQNTVASFSQKIRRDFEDATILVQW
jgi:molecular chaperone DnaK (HSP70)